MRGHRSGRRLAMAGLVAALLLVGSGPGRPAPAAAAPSTPWRRTTGRMRLGGLDRSYLLVRPTAVNATRAKLPVLVVLHGRNMTPSATEQMTGFLPVVGPAVYVYPAGYKASWNAGACCGEARAAGTDDVAFITAVVRHVLMTEPDASRREVYLVGYSNGGRMAFRLACAAPTMFAGVAAVEAVSVYACPRPKPVSLVEVASADDPLVAVDAHRPQVAVNGFPEPTVEGLMAQWRQIDACGATPTPTVVGSLRDTVWSSCRSGTRLGYALYSGGSHAWPKGDQDTPPAERSIWAFFRDRPPGAPVAPVRTGLPG